MTEPLQPVAASDHARHDPNLIAALAAREADLDARDVATARDLVARCTACQDLLADLVALQVALPLASTPTRPRDFTLTDADARWLRGSGWRRALGFFGSARDAFSKPLAVGFTTIGIVALVVTAAPGLSFGMASSGAAAPDLSAIGAPVPGAGGAAPQPASSMAASQPSREIAGAIPSNAASAAPSMASAAPSASAATATALGPIASAAASVANSTEGERSAAVQPGATDGDAGNVFTGSNDTDDQPGDADVVDQLTDAAATPVRSGGPSLGIVIAGISLILGLGLFALRWTSRRLSGS